MKRIAIISAVAMICLASCAPKAQDPSENLKSFIEDAVKNADSYTDEQWEQSGVEYQKLLDEFINSEKEYTSKERREVLTLIASYYTLLIQHQITCLVDSFSTWGEQLEDIVSEENMDSLFSGIGKTMGGLEGTMSDVKDKIGKAIDQDQIEKVVGDIGKQLEGMFK